MVALLKRLATNITRLYYEVLIQGNIITTSLYCTNANICYTEYDGYKATGIGCRVDYI